MRKSIVVALTLSSAMVLSSLVAAEDLQTTAGTMQLGGRTTFSIDMFMPEKGDSQTGFWFQVSPNAGYFVIDDLELTVSAGIGLGFGDLYDGSSKNYSFGAGANYFIGVSSFKLHLGVAVAMAIMSPDKGDSIKSLAIGVPIGLLIPLNQHVGVDLGTTIIYNVGLDDQGSSLNVPIGYLGVQAFF
ncbi:MAG: hypothetical protein GXP49_13090 [Deltaproteobacteria bacterium]|nr:hypothetical protein [Deltaproteobacteria bacterium]